MDSLVKKSCTVYFIYVLGRQCFLLGACLSSSESLLGIVNQLGKRGHPLGRRA